MSNTTTRMRANRAITASSREEFIADISLVNGLNTTYQLPNSNMPMDRFMFGMRLQFEGRFTIPASGNPTGNPADAPWSILDNIAIEGLHRPRRQREKFIDCRGADLRQLNQIMTAHAPLTLPASLVNTANATNDIRFSVDIPFVPANFPISQQIGYLLDCPNYDSLQLTLKIGDDKNVFSGQSNAPTLTAFGSASGSARVRVFGLFALDGAAKFAGFVPGRVWRTYQEVSSGDIVSGNTQSRLFNPPKGYRVRSMLLKAGTKGSATAGNNVYATLSNSILSNMKVNVGLGRAIRTYTDMYSLEESVANCYGILPTTGYGLIDFAQRGHMWEVLDTSGLIAGATGDVDFYLAADIAGGASQAALLLTEELRNYPRQV